MIKRHKAMSIAGKYAHRGEAIKLFADKGVKSDFLVGEIAEIYKELVPKEYEHYKSPNRLKFEELRLLLDYAKGGIKILR